ncbi:MAG: S-methyl-5-thioribose-1-phosphate isomerase [candidate division Zixibacteria bacterium]|nr:S-methyl-5-thioribose-1-phosphate isomerase [candidate division Zixibacteria bacterium]
MTVKSIERIDNHVRLIAQTLLPGEIKYLEIDNYTGIIEAIKRLDIRGAPAIGIAAAYGLALAVQYTGDYSREFIDNIAAKIKTARPTAVNLSWAVNRVLDSLTKEHPDSLESVLTLLWSEAENIHKEDHRLCKKIGFNGAQLINDGDVILTHCNAGALATGGIGTALGVIYTCHNQGKSISVYADETRPLLQGARLTAWELMREGIDVTLICDSVAASLMRQGRIDDVIVGADRVAANGDFANKIGTYSIAVHAKEHGIPFYVAAPYSTFDSKLASEKDIPIEERPASEVTDGFGVRTAPNGVHVYSPAFDITPFELVSYYITEQGIKPGGRV